MDINKNFDELELDSLTEDEIINLFQEVLDEPGDDLFAAYCSGGLGAGSSKCGLKA